MPKTKTSREALIRTSLEVFRQQGYHGTSVSDLSKACDIPKSHFYYYFPDGKQGIMQASLEAILGYFEAKVLPLSEQADIPPALRMEQLLNRFRRVVTEGEGGCFMANTTLETLHTSPQFRPVLRQFFDGLRQAVSRLNAHVMSAEAAVKEADRVIQDFEGGVLLMRLYGDPVYVDEAIQRALLPFQI